MFSRQNPHLLESHWLQQRLLVGPQMLLWLFVPTTATGQQTLCAKKEAAKNEQPGEEARAGVLSQECTWEPVYTLGLITSSFFVIMFFLGLFVFVFGPHLVVLRGYSAFRNHSCQCSRGQTECQGLNMLALYKASTLSAILSLVLLLLSQFRKILLTDATTLDDVKDSSEVHCSFFSLPSS